MEQKRSFCCSAVNEKQGMDNAREVTNREKAYFLECLPLYIVALVSSADGACVQYYFGALLHLCTHTRSLAHACTHAHTHTDTIISLNIFIILLFKSGSTAVASALREHFSFLLLQHQYKNEQSRHNFCSLSVHSL